jgi:hypothetical protein
MKGGRSEEIVDLKWNDIYELKNGIKLLCLII